MFIATAGNKKCIVQLLKSLSLSSHLTQSHVASPDLFSFCPHFFSCRGGGSATGERISPPASHFFTSVMLPQVKFKIYFGLGLFNLIYGLLAQRSSSLLLSASTGKLQCLQQKYMKNQEFLSHKSYDTTHAMDRTK